MNLGHACNLNCVFCWNHSPLLSPRSASWHRQVMSSDHADNVADALPMLRPDRMMLSGQGEPLIQAAAEVLIDAANRAGIELFVQTNGVAGVPVERLASVRRLLVNVSAATPEGYERTHPGRGHLLESVRKRLGQVAELRARGRGPDVTLIAIVQRANIDELVPLVDLAASVGATTLHLKGMEHAGGLESLMFEEQERDRVRHNLRLARERAMELGVSLRATHLEQVLDSVDARLFTSRLKQMPCLMGWYYLRVTCDGRVMFCCKDKQVGHLDEAPLYRIWRSPVYHLHRLAARAGDPSTGLLDDRCQACSNFERNLEIANLLSD